MNRNLGPSEANKRKDVALSSSFRRSIYSEIEEIGWEHLVKSGEDLTYLSFRIFSLMLSLGKWEPIRLYECAETSCLKDKKGQPHILEIQLPQSYPRCAPSISADVPYLWELKWSTTSRLKDVVHQFHEHLEKLQEFWSTLDNIDRYLWVVDTRQPSRATSFRHINLGKVLFSGNDCCILLSINVYDPRSLPECRFLGPATRVDSVRQKWRRNSKRWMKDKPFAENLASVMETSLPGRPDSMKDDKQVECGICYAQCLPIDDELGAKSGSGPDYTCDNSSCNRDFHSVCLGDWLRSITTTRQSFHVLFGNCPYCSGPVAVKIGSNG